MQTVIRFFLGTYGEKVRERLLLIYAKILIVVFVGGAFEDEALARQRRSKGKTSSSRVVKKSNKDSDLLEKIPKECPSWKECWEQSVWRFLRKHSPSYGVFVAMEPATGEILALVEYSKARTQRGEIAQSAMFPAASIFKIVSTAALLSTGKARTGTIVCYHGGSSWIYSDNIIDTPKRDKACSSLAQAFARSTNGVYAKLAAKHLNADEMMDFAHLFGFNRTVKVEWLVTRSFALKPSDKLGLARMAAGFTNTRMSPLHGAVIAAVIANKGRLPDKVEFEGEEKEGERRVLDEHVAEEIASLMKLAATAGTGRRYFAGFRSGGGVAVKSGTLTSRDGSKLFNTWMVGFFPADKPEIAFSALLSTGRGDLGGIKAGHLAKFALESYQRVKKVTLSNR